jgi:hypothetical protein
MYENSAFFTNCAFRPYSIGAFTNNLPWPEGYVVLADPGRRFARSSLNFAPG